MEAFTELVTKKQHDEIGRDISRKTKAAKEAQKRKAEEAAAAASSSTERYFSKSIFDWATFICKLSEIRIVKGVVSVPVETGSNDVFYTNQRHRKPRGTFGKLSKRH